MRNEDSTAYMARKMYEAITKMIELKIKTSQVKRGFIHLGHTFIYYLN